MENNIKMEAHDSINMNDTSMDNFENKYIQGHVVFRDPETKEIISEQDNLVLMSTRVWLFQQLFGVDLPEDYAGKVNNNRRVCLFSIGSGGADVNANAFTPYVPRFSDQRLGQMIPFVVVDPDKVNNTESQANPSVVTELSSGQKNKYYMGEAKADGTKAYYAKRFEGATAEKPLGNSRGWIIDNTVGKVGFSLSLKVDKNEARGNVFNEIGLWMADYNADKNEYTDAVLCTRLCFASEDLSSLSKGVDIEYTLYI